MSSLLVPSGFYVSLALPFLSVVHALVLSVHTLSGPFPFTNDCATRALPPMIKQYKTCLLHVFCCFCSPFPLSSLPPFFLWAICWAQVFLFFGRLVWWFRFHSAAPRMRVSLGVLRFRSARFRYHSRRKIRFQCRIEAVGYLRFLYELCA